MLTLNRVKEVVDEVRPPWSMRWSMSFLENELNGAASEKLLFVSSQLTALTARCRISTLELFSDDKGQLDKGALDHSCRIKGPDAGPCRSSGAVPSTIKSTLTEQGGRYNFPPLHYMLLVSTSVA